MSSDDVDNQNIQAEDAAVEQDATRPIGAFGEVADPPAPVARTFANRTMWLTHGNHGYALVGPGGRIVAGPWCDEWIDITGYEVPRGFRQRIQLQVWPQGDVAPIPSPPNERELHEWREDEVRPGAQAAVAILRPDEDLNLRIARERQDAIDLYLRTRPTQEAVNVHPDRFAMERQITALSEQVSAGRELLNRQTIEINNLTNAMGSVWTRLNQR